jgi:sec-independent protein translocase protein TatA
MYQNLSYLWTLLKTPLNKVKNNNNEFSISILGTQEIIIIAIVVVLLFGAKKIPQLMRGVGSGIKEFKDGMKEGEKDSQEKNDKKEINSSDN